MLIRTYLGLAAAAVVAVSVAAVAQMTYKAGDRVEAYSSMTGTWVRGRIASIDGARYMFKADDSTLANDYWGTPPSLVRPIGAAPAPRPATVPPAPYRPAPTPPRPTLVAQGGCGGGGGGGAVRIAGATPAPLGHGLFPNGRRFGTPGQTNYLFDDQGRKSIVAVAPPGLGSFLGRYSLMVGGTWSTVSTRDLGGGVIERTLNWNVPAQANVLVINPDGTWFRKSGSTRYSGRWFDLGQNVAQLIGYDGDDWTGSVQRWSDGTCRMEMRGPLGQNEWGKRI